jgi:predicted nucleic acid-binding protein
MVLVDTSIWIDHFRNDNNMLKELLNNNEVLIHPFILGELACGSMRNRVEILNLLKELPLAVVADNQEVLKLIENKKLYGKGIGFIDAHLIASALLTKVRLLTMHKPLEKVLPMLNVQ